MAFWKRIAAVAIVAVMVFNLSGCSVSRANITEPVEEEPVEEENEYVTYENTYNGYKDTEIGTYERLRAKDLLEEYGFTDYSMDGTKRHYNYTVEDFRSIEELDETYVYALFVICDTETFNVVLEALGYEDLADYLIKRNYVDEEGNPDLIVWTVKNMEEMSEIMVEKSRELEYWSKVTMKETGRT